MKLSIDKTRLQAVAIAVPILVILAAGLYYYFFIRPTYGIFHEPWLAQDTAIRAVLKPVLVQSYVSSLAPTGSRLVPGVPRVSSLQQFAFRTEWIHKMPFEFSFLLDQRSPDQFGVLLFVREHPAAESFDDLVNNTRFFNALHPIRWEQPRMARQSGGQLIASGTLPIPVHARDTVSRHWPEYRPFDAPQLSGRHFIEVAVDNRNGALMELHGALMRAVHGWADASLDDRMRQSWPGIEALWLTGNLTNDDTIAFDVELQCASPGEADSIASTMDSAAFAIDQYLASRFGFALHGAALPAGTTIRGEYQLTGFEARLRRVLGG